MKLFSVLLSVGLIAVNTVLGFAAWELSFSPLQEPGNNPVNQSTDIDVDLPMISKDLQIIEVVAFIELATRPPFSSSRRPISAAPITQEKQPAPAPMIVITPLRAELIGVAIDRTQKTALIRVQSEQSLRMLERGDLIGGWELKIIEDARVVFKQEAEQTELLLRPMP